MGLSQFKDKVEKTVTRKTATSSAHVRDNKEAQTRTRYNLRKRKGQEEKDSCPTNTNKKPRRNIQTQNDKQAAVTNSRIFITRSKMGATKMMVSKEQASKTKSLKIPKWNQGKRISAQSLKRKNQSSMETIANRSKKAKTLKKKLQKSTSGSTRKANSLSKKETKSSLKLGTKTKSSPKIGSARKRNEKKSSPKLGNTSKSNETKSSPKLGAVGKRKRKPPPKLSTAGKGKRKEMKSSEKLSTAGKRKERISPKAKQENLRNKNPSTLNKRRRSSQVKEPIPEKGVQPKMPLRKKSRGYKELPGEFANIFLNKLDLVAQINHGYNSPIHGISVTHDDLVWVNYLSKRVNLYNSSGDLLRYFDLDYQPVFNSCTSNGDLLVTQGYGIGAKPTVELISREGNRRLLADLSTHTDLLCGILYQDEKIYVIGHGPDYFILKLDLNGEVEEVYETKPERANINHIISLNGQIVAVNTQKFSLLLLDSDNISTEVINKVMVDRSYSASASVDNFGNIIVGTDPPDSKIVVVDPKLERKHEIGCSFSGRIRATAVDHQNQLWIGTDDGKLYIAKYFK